MKREDKNVKTPAEKPEEKKPAATGTVEVDNLELDSVVGAGEIQPEPWPETIS